MKLTLDSMKGVADFIEKQPEYATEAQEMSSKVRQLGAGHQPVHL